MVEESAFDAVAVIGMAGRFPGARDVGAFFRNVRDGVESFVPFTREEMLAAGADPALLSRDDYVKGGFPIDGEGELDAAFFDIPPREAERLDPQHRLLLECAYEALEDAGYDPDRGGGPIGVFAGAAAEDYLLYNLLSRPDLIRSAGWFQIMLGNQPDYLATRVSYKLGLRGPSVTVRTACSTSLVAVHLAAQSVLTGESAMALAGGVTVDVPQRRGYLHEPGGILSRDGRCRPFDARAGGTAPGSGLGLVVLKRLSRALSDGDRVRAVLRASAINNDGPQKVGFTAPSVSGQAAVIREALALADVDPATIGYVEAHGTGTALGDPIEIAALTAAFTTGRPVEPRSCAVGSVKANIGHLNAAAGVAGLIKAVCCLEQAVIPPSPHFERPNPALDLDAGPFHVSAALSPWPAGASPRRAAVSSFGIGGTNAHAVLEEAPPSTGSSSARPFHVLAWSARTAAALAAMTSRLEARLAEGGAARGEELGDIAHTLQVGRKQLAHRRMIVCEGREDAVAALRGGDGRIESGVASDGAPEVVFLFPGQGAQEVGMGRALAQAEPVFREHLDACLEPLARLLGRDVREILHPDDARAEGAIARLSRTEFAQPLLFAVEHSLARTLMAYGISPSAMLGHSVGEIVAACLAGVMTLEAALELVAARGRLMQSMPPGGMLAVELGEGAARELNSERVSLAAVNGPASCVLAGPEEALGAVVEMLDRHGVRHKRLSTSHAFHSAMMDPILDDFRRAVGRLPLTPPAVPLISNVTGTWLSEEDATSADYWARHLRGTVRFADGARTLLEAANRVFIEVGPGQTLLSLLRKNEGGGHAGARIACLPVPAGGAPEPAAFARALGRAWLSGVPVDWSPFYRGERRQRVGLPTYPFERKRFWVEPNALAERPQGSPPGAVARGERESQLYLPRWTQASRPPRAAIVHASRWLLFVDDSGLGDALSRRLAEAGAEVCTVRARPGGFARLGELDFGIDPSRAGDHQAALTAAWGGRPDRVVHLFAASRHLRGAGEIERGFYSLIHLAQALSATDRAVSIDVVSSAVQSVVGDEPLCPERAALLGACRVIPQEMPALGIRHIDVPIPGERAVDADADLLLLELAARVDPRETVIAHRGRRRWVESFARFASDEPAPSRLRRHGVYLLTGGLGDLGLALAEHLVTTCEARVALVSRSLLPPRGEWDAIIAGRPANDTVARRLRRLLSLQRAPGEILVCAADAADRAAMARVIGEIDARFGALHGVFHGAAVLGEHTLTPVARVDRERCDPQFHGKVRGAAVLAELLADRPLDFVLLHSSLAAALGGVGMAAYAAANACLDAMAPEMARRRAGRPGTAWISVGWDGLRFTEEEGSGATSAERTLSPGEITGALARILARDEERWLVSVRPIEARRATWIERAAAPRAGVAAPAGDAPPARGAPEGHARPSLSTGYVAPRDDIESQIAGAWRDLLGIAEIGVHDDFFELGGDSLLGIRVLGRVRESFQVDLHAAALFEHRTVAALAARVVEILASRHAAEIGDAEMSALLDELERP